MKWKRRQLASAAAALIALVCLASCGSSESPVDEAADVCGQFAVDHPSILPTNNSPAEATSSSAGAITAGTVTRLANRYLGHSLSP